MLKKQYLGWFILYQLFQYPDHKFSELLKDKDLNNCLTELSDMGVTEAQALKSILDKLESQDIDDLAVEYTRLFITGIPKTVAPPYASLYLDSSGLLGGKGVEEITLYFNQAGVRPKTKRYEWYDHIAEELAFACYLLASGTNEALELYQQFLQEHFRPWVTDFFTRLFEGAKHPLYKAMGELGLKIGGEINE